MAVTIQSVRLVDGTRQLLLGGRGPFFREDLIVQKVSKTFPAVREQVSPRPDADGTDDQTARFGAAAVAVNATTRLTPAALVDLIASYMHPRARPYLYVFDDEWSSERRVRLRTSQFDPGEITPSSNIQRPVQLQWAAPDGVWEAADPTEIVVAATGGTQSGISFPTTFPITFVSTTGIGQTVHVNTGTAESDQRVRLYGPCAGPRWSNALTGESLVFSEDLVIPTGEYVEVDTRDHTAYYLSDRNADRLAFMDFEASTWWRIPPGQAWLRYHPTSQVDAGAAAVMAYRTNHM